MVSSKLHPLSLAAWLAVIAAANFVATAGFFWLLQEWQTGPGARFLQNQLHQIGIGILLSQVVLIGYWLGLGDYRWYMRLVAAIALTLGVALSLHCAAALSPSARRSGDEDAWAIIGFILIAMMLAISLVGFILRRTRGWRLTWRQNNRQPVIHQFQIADGLLWMVVIGGALAAMRFVVSIQEDFRSQFLDISLLTVRGGAVVLIAMMTAFARVRPIRAVLILAAVVVTIGIGFAIPDVYRDLQRTLAVVTGPIAWNVYLSNGVQAGLGQLVLAVAATSGALANCLALRLSGCRLIRPANSASSPLIEPNQD